MQTRALLTIKPKESNESIHYNLHWLVKWHKVLFD